ncbi:unnamed protein product [Mytilus coruscus]|uniref:FAM234A/B beta-propeller domain-containing protein n=1 Tax=Mytilus coruscus TaxID=42192 RepID=A0A6J8DQ65_MYTCO|nr:unnamed protein product [Mytilus coruscus]
MGNSLKTKATYEVDYSSVPLSTETDSEDDVLYASNLNKGNVSIRRVSYNQQRIQNCSRRTRVGILCLVIVVIVIVIGVLGTQDFNKTTSAHSVQSVKGTNSWKKKLDVTMGEADAAIRLVDVDGDGLEDIILAAGPNSKPSPSDNKYDTECKKIGLEAPCYGNIYALRGTDGTLLWNMKTTTTALFLNCVDFDVNLDGQIDCIASGRFGSVIWSADRKIINTQWNVFHVAKIQDIDDDGVPEMVVANGGDTTLRPQEHNRTSGRLVMLSGRTGKMVGHRFLNIPDNKETYMSPIVYRTADGSRYILFGSGGETISGNLMMISLPEFYTYITNGSNPVEFEGNYNQWIQYKGMKNKDTGIFTLHRGNNKGVIVPPVVADVNNDGFHDILMTAFQGHMILYSGKDLSLLWRREFPNMETYTSPAPGYFNNDNILDFMVHWSLGEWPQYSETKIYILNGKDGSTLWALNGNQFVMSSDLSIRTSEHHRDLFLFNTLGRGSPIKLDKHQNIQGIERLDKIAAHGGHLSTGTSHQTDLPNDNDKKLPFNSNQQNQRQQGTDKNNRDFQGIHNDGNNTAHSDFMQHYNGPITNKPQKFLGDMKRKRKLRKRKTRPLSTTKNISCEYNDEIMQAMYDNRHFMCTDEAELLAEVFILDRTTLNNPVRLLNHGLEAFMYSVPNEVDTSLPSKDICTMLVSTVLATASIGDVDGDGILDLIARIDKAGDKFNRKKRTFSTISYSTIVKISLHDYLRKSKARVNVDAAHTFKEKHLEKNLVDVELLPSGRQIWTSYMGKMGNGYYDMT